MVSQPQHHHHHHLFFLVVLLLLPVATCLSPPPPAFKLLTPLPPSTTFSRTNLASILQAQNALPPTSPGSWEVLHLPPTGTNFLAVSCASSGFGTPSPVSGVCCVSLPSSPRQPALISGVRSAIVREPTSVQPDSPFTLNLTCLLQEAVRHVLSQCPDRSETPVIRVQAPLHLTPVLAKFGVPEVEGKAACKGAKILI